MVVTLVDETFSNSDDAPDAFCPQERIVHILFCPIFLAMANNNFCIPSHERNRAQNSKSHPTRVVACDDNRSENIEPLPPTASGLARDSGDCAPGPVPDP